MSVNQTSEIICVGPHPVYTIKLQIHSATFLRISTEIKLPAVPADVFAAITMVALQGFIRDLLNDKIVGHIHQALF